MPFLADSGNGKESSRAKKLAWLIFGYAIVLALTTSVVALGSSAVGITEVSIESGHAEQNASTAVPVTIYNATDLGSIDLVLSYDPAVGMVTSITAGDFDVTVTNLEETANGSAQIVAFQAANPGLNGTVVLAQVTLGAVGAADSTTPLNLNVNRMTDATPHCHNLSYSITNGSFTVIPTTEPTPTPPPVTPSPENGGGGQGDDAWLSSEPVDSDGDGYSDFYERLTGSDPDNPCDPDPTCSACQTRREEISLATPTASASSTPAPSHIPSTPIPIIDPAPSSSVPPQPLLEVLKPPEPLLLVLLAAILLAGLLVLVVSHGWRRLR